MYEAIQNANGAYSVQLKLLAREAMLLKAMGVDEKLITKYLERQNELASIKAAKEGESVWEGFKAGVQEANLNMQTFGAFGADLAENSINDMTTGIWEAVRGTESLNDSMRKVAISIGDAMIKMGINTMLTASMSAIMPTPASKISGNTSYSKTPYPVHHSGGIVGEGGFMRSVNASVFNGAVRAHNGLLPGERPIIAKDDEGVFTPGQMKALGSRSAPNVSININNESGGQVDATQQDVNWDGNRMLVSMVVKDRRNMGPISRMQKKRG